MPTSVNGVFSCGRSCEILASCKTFVAHNVKSTAEYAAAALALSGAQFSTVFYAPACLQRKAMASCSSDPANPEGPPCSSVTMSQPYAPKLCKPSSMVLANSFSKYFEKPVSAFPVGTGTAANALALALATPRFASIYCHQYAHIETTECGASEAWAGGSKLVLLPGEHNRISADILKSALLRVPRGPRPQAAAPAVVSITQGTEAGTVYSLDEIAAISNLAHANGLLVHMDGARFSNALVKLGCSPADMTWRAGVDILSYGATKNGGMCAEGVVVFNPDIVKQQGFLRRRSGQLYSKMRYLSVQLIALLEGGTAEQNAGHANDMAQRLAKGLGEIPGARLLLPVDINEIFVYLPEDAGRRLQAAGYQNQLRNDHIGPHYRLVPAWNTSAGAVDDFVAAARGAENTR
jgi:threonine aldolase